MINVNNIHYHSHSQLVAFNFEVKHELYSRIEKLYSLDIIACCAPIYFFDGPQNLSELNRGLVQLMKKDGFTSLQQAVGSRNPLPIIAESESPVLTNVKKEAA